MEDDEALVVQITAEEYQQLKDDSLFLSCLEAGGVDNWDWYGEAQEEYERQKEEQA